MADIFVPEEKRLIPCSHVICTNGHEWLAQMLVTKCNGCKADVLAIRVVNCPVCNEPAERYVLRLDQLATGMQVTAICKGAQSGAIHTGVLELERQKTKEEEKMLSLSERIDKELVPGGVISQIWEEKDQSAVGQQPENIVGNLVAAQDMPVGSVMSTVPVQIISNES